MVIINNKKHHHGIKTHIDRENKLISGRKGLNIVPSVIFSAGHSAEEALPGHGRPAYGAKEGIVYVF